MSTRISLATKTSEIPGKNSVPEKKATNSSKYTNSPIDQILFLQRTIGNQAVQGLLKSGAIQAKLSISQPGDIYEQQSDRIAEWVMRIPDSEVSGISKGNTQVQRKCAECASGQGTCPKCKEEEIIQRKPIASTITSLIQRQSEEAQEEDVLQKKEVSAGSPEITSDLESRINGIKGGGQPLTESVRDYFEPRFGYDFSGVRIHTDSHARESAKEINALAYTVGRDVVFGAGRYAPGTSEGRRLLAHELTHVVQQDGATHSASSHRNKTTKPIYPVKNKGSRVIQRQKADEPAPDPTLKVVDHGTSQAASTAAKERMTEILSNLKDSNRGKLRGLTIELHIIPHDKKLTDLPEFASLKGVKTHDGRLYDDLRGVGGTKVGSVIRYAVAEEQLVHIPGSGTAGGVVGGIVGGLLGAAGGAGLGALIGSAAGPVGTLVGAVIGGVAGLIGGAVGGAVIGSDIGSDTGYARGFVAGHESGHVVEQFALTDDQRTELNKLFAERKKKGGPWLSPEPYTSSNAGEYFAQSAAAFFGRPYSESRTDRETYTREWLRTHDPGMYRLLSSIFK